MGTNNLSPYDGELYLSKAFISQAEADRLFTALMGQLDWQEESILIYGRRCKVPRLTCWYGDAEADYRYSGVDHLPKPWTGTLLSIRHQIEQHCTGTFNSVLGNLYRDGQDSMGFHADNEKELGKDPVIASLSLGDERIFKLRHKNGRQLDLPLGHGDLLVMAGSLQHHWQHALPKTKQPKTPRINLTFRKILPA